MKHRSRKLRQPNTDVLATELHRSPVGMYQRICWKMHWRKECGFTSDCWKTEWNLPRQWSVKKLVGKVWKDRPRI